MLDFLKWLFGIRTEKLPHEMEKGIPKPSYLLAGILQAKIIQNFDKIKKDTNHYNSGFYTYYLLKFENVGFKFQLSDSKDSIELWDELITVRFDGKDFDFDKPEADQLIKVLRKAHTLKQEKTNRDKYYAREQLAVDLIEKMFKYPETVSAQEVRRLAQQNFIEYNYDDLVIKTIDGLRYMPIYPCNLKVYK